MTVFLNIFVITTLLFQVCLGQDKCLASRHHKDAPSPESKDFQECLSWQENSCCRVNVSDSIHHHRARNLYNYHWDKCGLMSEACEKYLVNEECFYQCEPRLILFQIPESKGYVKGVPICASYCDKWFEACKNDKTCVEDWLEDWDYDAEDGENHCPKDSQCITFTEMYGDARGLCNKMWGHAFFYEEGDNCMVMNFNTTGENPNSNVNNPASGAPRYEVSHALGILIFLGVGLATIHVLNL